VENLKCAHGKLLNAIYHSGDNGNVSLTLTRKPRTGRGGEGRGMCSC